MSEEDMEGWKMITESLGKKIQLVGDDFLTTNPKRLKEAIKSEAANSILIKPNQIGTITETIRAINMAKDADYTTVASLRSGEAIEETTCAHLAVGLNLGQIKVGGFKTMLGAVTINDLLRIEEYLGEQAVYRDKAVLSHFL